MYIQRHYTISLKAPFLVAILQIRDYVAGVPYLRTVHIPSIREGSRGIPKKRMCALVHRCYFNANGKLRRNEPT